MQLLKKRPVRCRRPNRANEMKGTMSCAALL
nr:MAG TPA: hypothetical protein [Caudoviricetes sp.]